MKRQILIILIFTFIGLTSCQNLEIEDSTPECIENMINDFDKEESCENGVNVKRYTFQGIFVYVFNKGDCGNDITSEVIDYECNSLGFLGGIIGNVAINGEAFSNATFESITWER